MDIITCRGVVHLRGQACISAADSGFINQNRARSRCSLLLEEKESRDDPTLYFTAQTGTELGCSQSGGGGNLTAKHLHKWLQLRTFGSQRLWTSLCPLIVFQASCLLFMELGGAGRPPESPGRPPGDRNHTRSE